MVGLAGLTFDGGLRAGTEVGADLAVGAGQAGSSGQAGFAMGEALGIEEDTEAEGAERADAAPAETLALSGLVKVAPVEAGAVVASHSAKAPAWQVAPAVSATRLAHAGSGDRRPLAEAEGRVARCAELGLGRAVAGAQSGTRVLAAVEAASYLPQRGAHG